MMGIIIIFMGWLSVCSGYIAYDCGTNLQPIAALSILNVKDECSPPTVRPNVSQVNVQLLQLSEKVLTRIFQCKINVDRTIHNCGMDSSSSAVKSDRKQYIMDISRDQCMRLHQTKSVSIGLHNPIIGLKANASTSQSMTLAGKMSEDGQCQGVEYEDVFGLWSNVVVQAVVTVSLQESYESVLLEANQIKLPSGKICVYSTGRCIDNIGGWTFWELMDKDLCESNSYDILWSGTATKIQDELNEHKDVYSFSALDITFAFTNEGRQELCSHELIKTEHPRLYIFEIQDGQSFNTHKDVSIQNIGILRDVISDLVYTESYIRRKIASLYKDVLVEKCNLDQLVFKNSLPLASIAPDKFAYNLMKEPGYMATQAGEVIYLTKCIAVDVKIRHTKECYHQLAVQNGDRSMFVTPNTHILHEIGLQIDCDDILRPLHLIDGRWYSVNPHFTEVNTPMALTKSQLAISSKNIETSEVYSDNQLKKFRDHLQFYIEQPTILNTIARVAMGRETNHAGINISNLIEENMIEQAIESYWENTSNWLFRLANYMQLVTGFYVIIMMIKYLLDITIRAYTLHGIYGCGVPILAALWDSFAYYFIYFAKNQYQSEKSSV